MIVDKCNYKSLLVWIIRCWQSILVGAVVPIKMGIQDSILKVLTLLTTALRWFLLIILLLFSLTSLLWKIWWLGALLLLIAFVLWRKDYIKSAVIIAIFILSLPLAFNQISNRMDYLGNLIRTEGSQALNTMERVSIYFSNITMAVGGFLILAPEVAVETLFLMDPRGKEKSFNSDFAMGSKHVREIISNYSQKVETGSAPLQSERIPLRWGPGYNTYSMFDYRVALAVAGGGLFLNYKKTENGYIVKCRITIDVNYSEDYKLEIFNGYGTRLYIDEAIFSALQELRWFHPYYAHYYWTLDYKN